MNIICLLKMAGDGIEEAQRWLTEYFQQAEGDFFACTPEEGSKAFLHRFAAAGAADPPIRRCMPTKSKIFWRWISPCAVTIPSGSNICRPKSTASWCISSNYGHFMCHVFHQDYIVRKGVDAHALKEKNAGVTESARRPVPGGA
ncbi:D-lactate dehydrogenase [Klebsiella pneumoniae]|uniref:D-lactate dehydrogenase n=1 Tax=Klebsiella pneumoniae TaxID=573 RepID=A0A2X3GYY8_KLEPN|nr:D-lactate dehydrogenase [Klebsiella pneumoniae]